MRFADVWRADILTKPEQPAINTIPDAMSDS
jgi:hypothetical protein